MCIHVCCYWPIPENCDSVYISTCRGVASVLHINDDLKNQERRRKIGMDTKRKREQVVVRNGRSRPREGWQSEGSNFPWQEL